MQCYQCHEYVHLKICILHLFRLPLSNVNICLNKHVSVCIKRGGNQERGKYIFHGIVLEIHVRIEGCCEKCCCVHMYADTLESFCC